MGGGKEIDWSRLCPGFFDVLQNAMRCAEFLASAGVEGII